MVREGKTFIHPFDDADIIAGQGTIALEVLEDLKETDMILVPVGGGGLISGIASADRQSAPAPAYRRHHRRHHRVPCRSGRRDRREVHRLAHSEARRLAH